MEWSSKKDEDVKCNQRSDVFKLISHAVKSLITNFDWLQTKGRADAYVKVYAIWSVGIAFGKDCVMISINVMDNCFSIQLKIQYYLMNKDCEAKGIRSTYDWENTAGY